MASSAAVEETVANPVACSSATAIDPLVNRTASGSTSPAATRSAHSLGSGQRSRWVCCSPARARSLTTADPAGRTPARARRISVRSSAAGGTLAWAANTTSPSGAGPCSEGTPSAPARKGSRASATTVAGAERVARAANSARSRRLCTMSTSQQARSRTARSLAGTLTPGSPVTSSGRPRPRIPGSRDSAATTGPVHPSTTRSGRSAMTVAAKRATDITVVPLGATASTWAGDGITGLRTTTVRTCQPSGRAATVAAVHFR